MHATAHSKITSKIRATRVRMALLLIEVLICPARRDSKRWPAIMLAASRIARVAGRIVWLTASIITIKGINGPGVPFGTRWAMHVSYWWRLDQAIEPAQRGKATAKVNTGCLEGVNTYGNKPSKFEASTVKKKVKNSKKTPGVADRPNTALSSLRRARDAKPQLFWTCPFLIQ